jgi:uncharacterized GH25 family protein
LSLRLRAAACAAALLAGLLLAATAAAHDFWIEPSSFHPAVGSQLAVSLRVGEHFRGEPVPRADPRIVKFVLASGSGETAIGGLPGTDPAGFTRVPAAGFLVIGYRSNRSSITLEPEKFEKYLEDEGLDHVLKARAARNEHGKPGNEVYSRCAKSLIAGGGKGEAGFDRDLGLTLELVAESNPSKLKPGDPMRLKLLHEGRPLPGALVKLTAQEEPDGTAQARTDRDGRVSFRLPRKGVWLARVVHMVAAPADTGSDWESLWASLTFEVP